MSIMAKTPSGYKKIGSAYLGERPVDKVFNANGDVVYALQRELTGVPPLLFEGKERSELLNYRIYGDTVDGNSVGDLVESGEHAGEYKVPVTVEGKNLFDGNFLRGYWAYADGSYGKYPTWICTTKISCTGGQMYTYSFSKASRWSGFVWYDGDGDYISTNNCQDGSNTQYRLYCATAPSNATYMAINIAGYPDPSATILPSDIADFMLVAGEYTSETMPNYEPYHAPVTTPIYLPEPIKMVGNEAEYVDYKEQKMHRIGADDIDVTLPALPTTKGTNVLSVDTEIQPSRMDIKGRIKTLT